jgi:hypothetical protein
MSVKYDMESGEMAKDERQIWYVKLKDNKNKLVKYDMKTSGMATIGCKIWYGKMSMARIDL